MASCKKPTPDRRPIQVPPTNGVAEVLWRETTPLYNLVSKESGDRTKERWANDRGDGLSRQNEDRRKGKSSALLPRLEFPKHVRAWYDDENWNKQRDTYQHYSDERNRHYFSREQTHHDPKCIRTNDITAWFGPLERVEQGLIHLIK